MARAPPETLSASMFRAPPISFGTNPTIGSRGKDFGTTLLECVDETLADLLGQKVRDAAYLVLEKNYIPRGDIPVKPDKFGSFLEEVFGIAGLTIGRAIARRLYTKLGMRYAEIRRYKFQDYIQAART